MINNDHPHYRKSTVRRGNGLYEIVHNSERGVFTVKGPDGWVWGPYDALFRHVERTVAMIHEEYLARNMGTGEE